MLNSDDRLDLAPEVSIFDLAMMELACAQAERGRGRTSPNPLVGAVLVDDDPHTVLATGYHQRAGADHAETAALKAYAGSARGKTLYVTLEPCNHVGRTGNCTETLVAAGLARVVIGIRDTNPGVKGGGVERLRAAGVKVQVGVLQDACRRQNRAYLHWLATGRPYMIMKAAVSLDGRLAPPNTRETGPVWLTGPEAQRRAHQLRDLADAILVGAGTVLADDPFLTVRLSGESPDRRPPLRVVLDGALRVPETARICAPGTLLLTSATAFDRDPAKGRALSARGAEVLPLPAWGGARPTDLDLLEVLRTLGRRDLLTVLCEGGGELHGALLGARLYDEAAVFIAPVFLGETGVPLLRGFHISGPTDLRSLTGVSVEPLGGDALVRGFFDRESPQAPPKSGPG